MLHSQSPAAALGSDVRESRDITLSEATHNESLNYSAVHGDFYLNVAAISDSSFLQTFFFSFNKRYQFLSSERLHFSE